MNLIRTFYIRIDIKFTLRRQTIMDMVFLTYEIYILQSVINENPVRRVRFLDPRGPEGGL